jgi:hypothetical protein
LVSVSSTIAIDGLEGLEPSADKAIGMGLGHQTGAFQPFQHRLADVLAQSTRVGRFGYAKFLSNTKIQQQLLKPVKSFFRDVRTD